MCLSNVLKMNEEDLAILTAMFSLHGDMRQRVKELAGTFGFKVAILTRGSAGSLIHREGQWSEMGSDPHSSSTQ
jgi:fructokinase